MQDLQLEKQQKTFGGRDPLGELKRSPDSLAVKSGNRKEKGEERERKGKEKGGKVEWRGKERKKEAFRLSLSYESITGYNRVIRIHVAVTRACGGYIYDSISTLRPFDGLSASRGHQGHSDVAANLLAKLNYLLT